MRVDQSSMDTMLNALDRFEIDDQTGCWTWTGAINEDGYGQISIRTNKCKCGITTIKAHRLFYVYFTDRQIPDGLSIDHLCRNRKCVNPNHLEPVTNAENVRRGNGARLSVRQVAEIRERYAKGDVSQAALAKDYGIAESGIRRIVIGASWIAGLSGVEIPGSRKQGVPPKVSPDKRQEIIGRILSGERNCVLAREYGISPARVTAFKHMAMEQQL